jgi:amino acid adenylation domain-containing protein
VARPRPERVPLSFAQQRLWFLEELTPGSSAYLVAGSVRLTGTVDAAAVTAALAAVVLRHEVLRTVFVVADGVPYQSILDSVPVRVVTDPAEPWDAGEPFDLAAGPLFRARLVRLSDTVHELIMVVHHIVCDGASMPVILRDLAAGLGERADLPPLAVQYADYTLWQREWLAGAERERQVDYWRSALAGAPPVLELPTDRPRPPVPTDAGGTLTRDLPAGLLAAAREVARDRDVTLFMTLQAALSVLLGRLSGQDDVVVGTPIANRAVAQLEPLVGLFVNTLALRTPLAGDPSFETVLDRTRESTLGAYAHQDLPFEHLVEELALPRDLAHTPLFQVMFTLQHDALPVVRVPGLELAATELSTGTAKFDLTLTVQVEGEVARTRWEYRRELFDEPTVARYAEYYETLLTRLLAHPDRPVRELSPLTETQRHELTHAWSRGSDGSGDRRTAPARIMTADPDAIALTTDTAELTYGELDTRTAALAAALRAHGVGPDSLVGLCAQRGIDLVVGLVAILRAGGAYVPLDPTYPAARLGHILADASPAVILAQPHLVSGLPPHTATVIDLTDPPAVPPVSDVDPAPGDLAYVLYTSGSTGRPKGVAVTHANLTSFLSAMDGLFGPGPGQSWLGLTSTAFDISVLELVWTLSSGARVVLLDESADVLGAIERHGVTHVQTTPSFAQRTFDVSRLSGVDTMMLGGEVFSDGLAEQLGGLRDTRVINGYGPTEATVYTATHVVAPNERSVPIGRAVGGARVHVLDERFEPVPVGVVGELFIGGGGVVRGYLNRPALTAERFVPDPFGEPGARLYRTGDLARFRADGDLEFLGRRDHQVKVRGYRVELDEIDAVLSRHPSVGATVTVVHGTGPDAVLVAYLEAAADAVADVRDHLRAELPTWMQPSLLIPLAELPLTPNKKVDRSRLPAPEPDTQPVGFRPPETPAEHRIAEIWQELLDADRVGLDQNFFDLGGHSLLATQVVARIRQALHTDLPLRAIFEHPTVGELAPVAERLAGGGRSPVVAAARPDRVPLSFAQQRLWFLDQLSPGDRAYLVAGTVTLTGTLDQAALSAALTALVDRHEALRTVFPTHDGNPYQSIMDSVPVSLRVTDLSGLGERATAGQLRSLCERMTTEPFDLTTGPLLRAHLVRTKETSHVLIVVVHHIVCDGWSLAVMLDELAAAYREPDAAPPLPVQYADYTLWQHDWFAGPERDRQVAYWRDRLAGAPPVLELPTDRPRPRTTDPTGANHHQTLPAGVAESLSALARSEDATLFMALHAAFAVLLSRLSGQDDVVVGTPVANRPDPALENLIGFFANTLALRTDLSGDPTFRELLTSTRDTTLAAYANQDLPFEHLVDELGLDRDLSRNPLFQAMLAFQHDQLPSHRLGDLDLRAGELDTGTAKFDLTLTIVPTADGLHARWEYRRDLFDDTTIARFAGHYLTLLEALLADPDRPIGTLPLLTPEERDQQLHHWNPDPIAVRDLAHHLIAAHAAEYPDTIALVTDDRELSYGDLDARADALADLLIGRGVGPDSLVGLCAQRGIDGVIGLLAILKAGGAYLPLDPTYPAARLRQILDDARPRLVLTQRHLVGELPAHDAETVLLEDPPVAAAAPRPRTRPGDLAYVLYTSGSTGAPKGVGVCHANLSAFLAAMDAEFGAGGDQTWLGLTSTAFDISVLELVWTLSAGARVVLLDESSADVVGTVVRHGVTHVQTTPSFAAKAFTGDLTDLAGLRSLLLGGEVFTAALVDQLAALTGTRVVNGYGPTEATVYATMRAVGPGERDVPIGRPVGGTRAYVLDRHFEPVPVGVAGELCLGGPGIVRGYLNRPGLTAERFVPDPFAGPGTRLYRTGDLARFRPDGVLEFVGRRDHQVKVRGYRIELDEVDAVLTRHPAVAAAVTTTHGTGADAVLAAYLLCDPAVLPDVRNHLRTQLPTWMQPTHLVPLTEFPLTPNKKIDRARLPAPDGPAEPAVPVAPRTATERAIARVWVRALESAEPSVHDNFFDLGGHSLLATQVVAHLRRDLDTELPLRAIFEHPTIAELARVVEEQPGASGPALVSVARPERIPLSFAQQRLWFLDQLTPGNSPYLVAGVVRLTGSVDVDALSASLSDLVARHEALRTVFGIHDGEPYQSVQDSAPVVLRVTDLSALGAARAAEQFDVVCAQITGEPFDLANGPLLRARLVRTSRTVHQLVLVVHHIACDGASMPVMFHELAAGYRHHTTGEPAGLPPLEVQYADHTLWQREWLAGPEHRRQVDHWRAALADAPPVLELPTDRPRPSTPDHEGALLHRPVAAPVATALGALARDCDATLFMALNAAFSTLLWRVSGQDDVIVGTPIANRVDPRLEPLVGFFVNTLALRTDLSGDPTFRELLASTRDTTLAAYANQDLPFEHLVDELRLNRDLSRNPLFQVMFTLQHAALPTHSLPGLTFSVGELDTGTAKFDLGLTVQQHDDGSMNARWEYRTGLFDKATIARLAGHFETLLVGILAEPDRPLSELALLTPAQRRALLPAEPVVRAPARYGHELITEIAATTPDSVALVAEDRSLTYAELVARADRLAEVLRHRGVGPDQLVGLCAERGLELIVGLLAILKAGGAYLPLDPAYPAGRIRQILDDARPAIVLTQQHLEHAGESIDLAAPPPVTGPVPEAVRPGPDNLAYVIYTSGSTGRPKGVAVSHANLSASTAARGVVYDRPLRGLVLLSSVAFDTSVASIFWALCHGATLHLPKEGRQLEVDHLAALTRREDLSHLVCLPSLYQLLLEQAPLGLATVVVAGEAVPPSLVDQHYQALPDVPLYNEYGPTEATVWSTVALCEPGGRVPIGRAIPGARVYVLDRHLEPVPVGVAGEVFLAGPGLTRGYLHRPGLTADRFVPDPHGGPGERMYRTGDLASVRPDGQLDFLGRGDHQVKVRGYRIELAEIDTALVDHPSVREAVTAVAGDTLVSYVVGSDPDVSALRAHLADRLPAWMRPTHVVVLPALPKTPNGKVDRAALPEPVVAPVAFLAPTTDVERQVAEVWQELLGVQDIGLDQNFFELGGHSLLLIKARERLRSLDYTLAMVDLFRCPTVRTLAAHLSGTGTGETEPPVLEQELSEQDHRAGRERLRQRRRRVRGEHEGAA